MAVSKSFNVQGSVAVFNFTQCGEDHSNTMKNKSQPFHDATGVFAGKSGDFVKPPAANHIEHPPLITGEIKSGWVMLKKINHFKGFMRKPGEMVGEIDVVCKW